MNARVLTLLTGLIWLGAASAAAPPDPSVIERALETTSTVTSIPTATGAISARSCSELPDAFPDAHQRLEILRGPLGGHVRRVQGARRRHPRLRHDHPLSRRRQHGHARHHCGRLKLGARPESHRGLSSMVFHKARNFALIGRRDRAGARQRRCARGRYRDLHGQPEQSRGAQHHADPGYLRKHEFEHDLAGPLQPEHHLCGHGRLLGGSPTASIGPPTTTCRIATRTTGSTSAAEVRGRAVAGPRSAPAVPARTWDRFARWRDSRNGGRRWRTLSTNGNPKEVECRADNGDRRQPFSLRPVPHERPATPNTRPAGGPAPPASRSGQNTNAGTLATLYSRQLHHVLGPRVPHPGACSVAWT